MEIDIDDILTGFFDIRFQSFHFLIFLRVLGLNLRVPVFYVIWINAGYLSLYPQKFGIWVHPKFRLQSRHRIRKRKTWMAGF